jgi:CHAT domain-containing protein
MVRFAIAFAAAVSTAPILCGEAAAQPLSVRDTFRIGTTGSVYCSAQSLAADRALTGMFDRGYAIVCRDAAVPVGQIYALRGSGAEPAQRLAALRVARVRCEPAAGAAMAGLGSVQATDCVLNDADVRYRVYQFRKGNTVYVAEGFAGYDSALQLALKSVVADRTVPGEVSIATTGMGDAAAFARVQAGSLDASRALAEAYRRNNSGSYAESAEFFASVSQGGPGPVGRAEGLVNEAVQKSNLGRYEEADALFSRAAPLVGSNPLVARQFRNYRAMHLLNQGDPKAAIQELDKPVPNPPATDSVKELVIDSETAARLSAESPGKGGAASKALLPGEKIEILDGQALQLRGAALRLSDNLDGASAALVQADSKLANVRGGRITSIIWMRAQNLADQGAIAEAARNPAEAERLYSASVALLEANYPGSALLLSARGRLAGYLARSGQEAKAEAIFRDIVKSQSVIGIGQPTLARVLAPYVELLIKKSNDPEAVAELFEASQAIVRPGVAATQATLARELSGGSDEASRLFRQSLNLDRQIERARLELARLESAGAGEATREAALRATIGEAQKEQVATQAKLADYPRFRVVSNEALSLTELQKQLRPGEAYYKMTVIGDRVYAILVKPSSARAVKVDASAKQLDGEVDSLSETISTVEDGQRMTYALDVGLARQLYVQLFQPFDSDLTDVRRLVFEPDGAMLRLPPNLLIASDDGIAAYRKRAEAGGDAEFDFTGLQWLGRTRDVSTSVSALAFRDVRSAPPTSAPREYLGLGDNAPPPGSAGGTADTRSLEDRDCALPLSAWAHPISPRELQVAESVLARANPQGAQIVTGAAFTDSALKSRSDLDQFRVLHFATHGIVTPSQRKCPAQPALLTSFGGQGSDGLLTFREIFDLKLNADLVILSACDTASKASTAATREAGLSSGGDVELDGLVRAFVAAGGRTVLASHWPVPDDFNATQRLITGLFTAAPGTSTDEALRQSQVKLMDDPATSHPFYWAAFAAIGDGSVPVIRQAPPAVAAR